MFAIVFKIKIEAIDLLIFVLCCLRSFPTLGLSFSKTEIYAMFVDKSTDSKIEHKNETPMAREK